MVVRDGRQAVGSFRSERSRLGWIGALAVLLSGCAYPFAQRADPQTATLVRELPATAALVMPPPGGPAVLSVLERRYANAIEQSILLANDSAVPGENRIEAVFYGPADTQNVPADSRLKLDHRNVVDIQRELRSEFPGIDMRISTFYAQNGYGPFGYAVGRGGGRSTCIYGWQQIEPPRNRFGEPAGAGAIKLRIRLCRADSSEEALLRFLYGYVISGYYLPRGWNPYGPVPPPPADLGALNAPMLPVPTGENPYYVDTRASRREGRVLPVAAPSARPAGPRAETRPVARAGLPEIVPAPGLDIVTSPIDPPLGMPSALPGSPDTGSPGVAAPTAPRVPRASPTVPAGTVRPAVPAPSGSPSTVRQVPGAPTVPLPGAEATPLRPTTTAPPVAPAVPGVTPDALRGTVTTPAVVVPPPPEP